jgi:hypothetical protein
MDAEKPKQPDDLVAQSEAAVKKAEDAERRLRNAEAGPMGPMTDGDEFEPDADLPGAADGGPG